jgi:hypothetical protein
MKRISSPAPARVVGVILERNARREEPPFEMVPKCPEREPDDCRVEQAMYPGGSRPKEPSAFQSDEGNHRRDWKIPRRRAENSARGSLLSRQTLRLVSGGLRQQSCVEGTR